MARNPPIRACIFDVDGLLINSEDLIPIANNAVLAEYGRPPPSVDLQAKLQGRPPLDALQILLSSIQLNITPQEFREKQVKLLLELFKQTQLLPGVRQLLERLAHAYSGPDSSKLQLAIATSSPTIMYNAKTQHLAKTFNLIPEEHKIMGDNPRIKAGRGKPCPDIFLLALETINSTLPDHHQIQPNECLVFEDAVIGVEAARNAGMRVVWVPHANVKALYADKTSDVLGDDGRNILLSTLKDFNLEAYSIRSTSTE